MNVPAPILECDGLSKSFSGVRVLEDLTFAVAAGGILGIAGENGAGKSTLMNVIGGVVPADQGSMRFGGAPYAPATPRDAAACGVAFVHQELNLFPNLTVAENLALGEFPTRRIAGIRLLDRRKMREQASAALRGVGLDADPDSPVGRLSQGERQLVEIAKAVARKARLLILDEPTTSLTRSDVERLFSLLRELRASGVSILYISHALRDVLDLCDRIVVLRDGRLVAQGASETFTEPSLISAMVGRSVDQLYPVRTSTPSPEAVLEISGLSEPGVLHRISFTLHRGEILGVAGLMGAGRTELARALFGLQPYRAGELRVNGAAVRFRGCREPISHGMALLTESRRDDGLLMETSAHGNLALVTLPDFVRFGMVERTRLQTRVEAVRKAVDLRGRADEVRTLSGGNQQKVVLGKWLLREPRVFILDEPTRGIDVGAKSEIYRLIDGLAARGAGVLLISSELEELTGMCDRILVMRRGEIRAEFPRGSFDRERILAAALGNESLGAGA